MAKYNNEFLIKVEVNDFSESWAYEYLTQIKFFGIVWRSEGVYSRFFGRNKISNNIDNHTVIDGVLYENPEVILFYPDNIRKRIIFKTLKEAERYAMDITDTKGWI